MPFYNYRCSKCGKEIEEYHSINEVLADCKECNQTDCLVKLPNIGINTGAVTKVGSVVNDFISLAKEELKENKERLTNKEYKK